MRIPGTLFAAWRSSRTVRRARKDALRHFETDILPGYQAYVAKERSRDLTPLSAEQVIAELHERMRRVLTEFGRSR